MVLTAAIVLLICLLVFTNMFNSRITNLTVKEQFVNKFNQVNDIIAQKYVKEEIDYEKMQDYAFFGYVAGLGDKYSTYYNKEEFKQLVDSNNGDMVGIGVSVILDKPTGAIKIVEVYQNSPASQAGIKAVTLLQKLKGKTW
jgi:carboxyl-terminal processing protease